MTQYLASTNMQFDAASTFADSLKQTCAAASLLNRENQYLLQQVEMMRRELDALKKPNDIQARLINSERHLTRSTAVIRTLQKQLAQVKQAQIKNISLIREMSRRQQDENSILLNIQEHRRQLDLSAFLRWVWSTYPPPRSRHDLGQLEGSKLLNMVRLGYHPDRLVEVSPGYKMICQEITKMINDT